MKKAVHVFLAAILLVNVVFSTFLPVFADGDSAVVDEPVAHVEVGGYCDNCGKYDTMVFRGYVSYDFGEFTYYEKMYTCNACGYTCYVVVNKNPFA